MAAIRNVLTRLSSSLGLPRAFTQSPRSALTTLLYHRFVSPGGQVDAARERLHRQLDWLQQRYTPLSPVGAVSHIERGTLPPFSLVVTSDDAGTDLLDIWDVFHEHGVPLAVFPCVGWVESSSPLTDSPTLSRVIDLVRWYAGPERSVDLGKNWSFLLNPNSVDRTIDHIIGASQAGGEDYLAAAWDVLSAIPREADDPRSDCNWGELADLCRRGVLIGSHTVTHCRLAGCSDLRLNFELRESKRAIEARLAPCETFAYPFGTADAVSHRTTAAIIEAGYRCAFLTRQDFAPNHADIHCLPRITIPDDNMVDFDLFRSLVLGGHIPWQKIKGMALSGFYRCEETVLIASFLGEFAA